MSLKACIVGWEGFTDENNNPVQFSREALEILLMDLDITTFSDIFKKVMDAISPTPDEVDKNKEASEELKNYIKKREQKC